MSQPVTALRVVSGVHLQQLRRVADGLVIAVAVSLPWSTSATSILVVLWLLAVLPTLSLAELRVALATPAGALPVLLVIVAALGMLWADVSWAERADGLSAFAKLAVIPLLIAQFRRSHWGQWVANAFLASSALLLFASWTLVLLGIHVTGKNPGVPVKDYISQGAVFTICMFALLDFAHADWKGGRWRRAAVLALSGLLFLVNMLYVVTSRTALVVIPILSLLFCLTRIGWKKSAWILAAGILVIVAAYGSSPYLRDRVTHPFVLLGTDGNPTSSGERMAFWTMSVRAIGAAPVIGHGTGAIKDTFLRQGSDTAVNPHNQLFAVGIQLGAVGMAVLIAMWAAHWLLFLNSSFASWFGLVVVTQNIVSSLFNSHVSDFTHGWIYVFGVGVAAGLVLRRAQKRPVVGARNDRETEAVVAL